MKLSESCGISGWALKYAMKCKSKHVAEIATAQNHAVWSSCSKMHVTVVTLLEENHLDQQRWNAAAVSHFLRFFLRGHSMFHPLSGPN